MGDFESELNSLINRYSMENGSNTPDFILTQYIVACLTAFNVASRQREEWYGTYSRPGTDLKSEPS